MIHRFALIIVCAICSAQPASASLEFSYYFRKAYEHVTALRFNQANQYIEAEKKLNPKNSLIVLVENYRDCMELILNENKSQLKAYSSRKSIRLEALEKENKASPYYFYAQAEINMHWAFTHIKNGEYLNGVLEVNRAYKMLSANIKKFPNFTAHYKSIGLLHALIGVIPDEYQWAVNMLGFSGSINQGKKELLLFYETSLNDTLYYCYQTEATLMLGITLINFAPDELITQKLLNQIKGQKQMNPILSFVYADICMHQGNSAEAANHLITYKYTTPAYFKFHYLNYLLGLARLYHFEDDANIYLEAYVNEFKGNTFIKAAYLKLAYHYLLHQQNDKYNYYLKQIPLHGNDITDEDKSAMKESANKNMPNLYLLKSRLLFDGGYYNESYNSLIKANKDDFVTVKEKLEFLYRLGRIQHKKENYQQAIYYYKMAMKNGADYPYYFAANAALNLGLIYEELDDKQMATHYFKACLKMKDHEYQRSIEQKAKAGLKRLATS